MTPNELEQRGTALFGKNWQTKLAGNLMVDPRTIRYWKSGKVAIPPYVARILDALESTNV